MMKLDGWTRIAIVLSGLWICIVASLVGLQLHFATAENAGILVEIISGSAGSRPPFTLDSDPKRGASWVVAVINYPLVVPLVIVPILVLWAVISLTRWIARGFREPTGQESRSETSPKSSWGNPKYKYFAFLYHPAFRSIASLATIVGVVWVAWFAVQEFASNNTVSPGFHSTSAPTSQLSAPALKRPPSGTIRRHTRGLAVAPLKIRTKGIDSYLVKLQSTSTGKDILDVFVHGGDTVKLSVPLGSYIVKYAAGRTWYGYHYYFGSKTTYSKADSVFRFERRGDGVSGYEITLYRVTNGNLQTSHITAAEF